MSFLGGICGNRKHAFSGIFSFIISNLAISMKTSA
jgi:hypothetical protein